MQISLMPEKKAAEIRKEDLLVIEDKDGTKKITVGEFLSWVKKQVTLDTRQVVNKSLDSVITGIENSKLLPERLAFKDTPWAVLLDKDSDPYSLAWIYYERDEPGKYKLVITDTATGKEVFRRELEEAAASNEASFTWTLRNYEAINSLTDEEKTASGLAFSDDGKYIYKDEDASNQLIIDIEQKNDTIIPKDTELLIGISCDDSMEYIPMTHTVTTDEVADVMKT